jgi:hypothetical protein
VEKVMAEPGIADMIEQCWIDGAKTYIKQDPSLEKDPEFTKRRFSPPKRIILGFFLMNRSIQEDAL